MEICSYSGSGIFAKNNWIYGERRTMENICVFSSVKKNLLQFIRFSLVGVLNTLISEGVYAVLTYFNMHYLPASWIGFSLSVLNAYFWNIKYVFREQAERERIVWWKSLYKTYVAYMGGYVLNALLLVLWMDIVRFERWLEGPAGWFKAVGYPGVDAVFLAGLLAAGVNLVITGPVNYLINKYWAFGKKSGTQPQI